MGSGYVCSPLFFGSNLPTEGHLEFLPRGKNRARRAEQSRAPPTSMTCFGGPPGVFAPGQKPSKASRAGGCCSSLPRPTETPSVPASPSLTPSLSVAARNRCERLVWQLVRERAEPKRAPIAKPPPGGPGGGLMMLARLSSRRGLVRTRLYWIRTTFEVTETFPELARQK